MHCITTNAIGTIALSSAIDGTIALWDLTPFATTAAADTNENQAAEAEAVSEEPTLLPLPVEDAGKLIIGSIDSLTSASTAQAKLSEAWKTALHPTLPVFASVGAGATVSLHSFPPGEDASFGATLSVASLPSSLAKQKDLFGLSLAFHSSGTLLAVGTNTGAVLLYTLSSNGSDLHLACTYADHPSPVRALSFTPHLLLVGSDDRTVSVHDIKPILSPTQSSLISGETRIGGTVASLSGHKGWLLALAATPVAEDVFASVGADKSIKFWDLASATKSTPVWNGSEVKTIRAFAFQPSPAAKGSEEVPGSGSGRGSMTRFVTASEDGRLRWYRGAGLG